MQILLSAMKILVIIMVNVKIQKGLSYAHAMMAMTEMDSTVQV